jgi:lipoyl(octanoyl) transferase
MSLEPPEKCFVYWLGMAPYQQTWALQEKLAAQIAAGDHPPALLLLEHPHTFTFGRRGQPANLLWSQAELQRRGVQVLWVDRGGDVTYHGPGQLVGYPLLPLSPGGLYAASTEAGPRLPQADYIGYLRRLEEALILALAGLGVAGERIEGLTGVWVKTPQFAKIASIGVKVDARGVSRHGFALNVNPDMSYWQGIIACGLKDAPAISLAALLDPPPPVSQVADLVIAAFGRALGYRMLLQGRIPL